MFGTVGESGTECQLGAVCWQHDKDFCLGPTARRRARGDHPGVCRAVSGHGFESTTIDHIVEVVGISRRSFFRYFGTKEDVVLGDLVARGEVIAANLAQRPADEDPWTAIRGALHVSEQTLMLDEESELALGRMLFDTPSLRARLLEKRLRWQELLVPLIEERLSGTVGSSTVGASAIVASALACLDAASEAWVAAMAPQPRRPV